MSENAKLTMDLLKHALIGREFVGVRVGMSREVMKLDGTDDVDGLMALFEIYSAGTYPCYLPNEQPDGTLDIGLRIEHDNGGWHIEHLIFKAKGAK